jgi:hypothetical protein
MLKMNDEELNRKKLVFMVKSPNLKTQEFEEYLIQECKDKKYEFALEYDVIASELPYFKTLQYTEYAGGVTVHPLQLEFRHQQMLEAFYAKDTEIKIDYVEYFANRVLQNKSNKYLNINKHQKQAKQALIALPGSNKLTDRVSYEKLRHIKNLFGDNVWVKPHPLTTFKVVGEVMDLFGEMNVLHRQADLYSILKDSHFVYTSMLSESALYAVCLGKYIEPIDVYQKTPLGSFYHINKFLFYEDDPQYWINKTFNDYRSGMFFPEIDDDWKMKVTRYLEYINDKREKFKYVYFNPPKPAQPKPKAVKNV